MNNLHRRRVPIRVLSSLIFLSVFALVIPVHGDTLNYQTGVQLQLCDGFGCHPDSFTGVQSQIEIGSQNLISQSILAAYWVSLDYFSSSCSSGQCWLQTGYILGTTAADCSTSTPPCSGSVYHSTPVFYREYNIPGVYHFETSGGPAWMEWHGFAVWTSGTTGYISIDGNMVIVTNGFSNGFASAAAEIHQPTSADYVTQTSSCPPCYGLAYWHTLQYQHNREWIDFGASCCGFSTQVTGQQTPPYYGGINTVNSCFGCAYHDTTVAWGLPGGGGCPCRRMMPPANSNNLVVGTNDTGGGSHINVPPTYTPLFWFTVVGLPLIGIGVVVTIWHLRRIGRL